MAPLIITPAQQKVSKFRITGQNREKYLLNKFQAETSFITPGCRNDSSLSGEPWRVAIEMQKRRGRCICIGRQ
jgi:hypothetical protein